MRSVDLGHSDGRDVLCRFTRHRLGESRRSRYLVERHDSAGEQAAERRAADGKGGEEHRLPFLVEASSWLVHPSNVAVACRNARQHVIPGRPRRDVDGRSAHWGLYQVTPIVYPMCTVSGFSVLFQTLSATLSHPLTSASCKGAGHGIAPGVLCKAGGRRFESARLHHRRSPWSSRPKPVDAEDRPLQRITRPQHAAYAGNMMRNT